MNGNHYDVCLTVVRTSPTVNTDPLLKAFLNVNKNAQNAQHY